MRARGGAAAAALLLAPAALLLGEGLLAGARTYVLPADAPVVRGEYGAGAPLTVAVLGDSTGAGLGVDTAAGGTAADTVGGQLATALAAGGRRVTLRGFAASGARASDLAGQVSRLEAADLPAPVVAVVLVGANDATHLSGLRTVDASLGQAVRRLRSRGARVVVGTCPDLGSARAFAQPLRLVAAWRGRAVARVEAAAVRAAGGEPVDLGALTGPAFRADPTTLSRDAFHPSMRGYALWAAALLPAVRRAAA